MWYVISLDHGQSLRWEETDRYEELLRCCQYLKNSIAEAKQNNFRVIHYAAGALDSDESFAEFCEQNEIRKETFEERMRRG